MDTDPLLEQRSGGGIAGDRREEPRELQDFLAARRNAVRRPPEGGTSPTWLDQAIRASSGNVDGLLRAALEHVRRDFNEENLIGLQLLLNDLGRTPQGTAAIRRSISEDDLLQLFELRCRR